MNELRSLWNKSKFLILFTAWCLICFFYGVVIFFMGDYLLGGMEMVIQGAGVALGVLILIFIFGSEND